MEKVPFVQRLEEEGGSHGHVLEERHSRREQLVQTPWGRTMPIVEEEGTRGEGGEVTKGKGGAQGGQWGLEQSNNRLL